MTILIPDSFDSEKGYADYDTDFTNQPIPAQLLANRHTDMRVFDLHEVTRPRTMRDLMTTDPNDPPSPWDMDDLDGVTMLALETVEVLPGETWSMTGTGGAIASTAPDDSTVGDPITGVGRWPNPYYDWRGLKFTCNGAALAATFLSDWPDGSEGVEVDISAHNVVSIVIDDSGLTGASAVATVTIQLNSDPLGAFGNGFDSDIAATTQTASEWKATMTDLLSGADVDFDPASVTGVKIVVTGNGTLPTNNDVMYLFGLRAYDTGYDPSKGPDINTRYQAVMMPVTFNLAAPSASIPMIRGTTANDPGDPRVQDGTSRIHAYKGLLKSGNANYLRLYFRESRSPFNEVMAEMKVAGATGGNYVRLSISSTVDGSGGGGQVANLPLSTLTGVDWFVFEAQLQGRVVTLTIYKSDEAGKLISILHHADYTPVVDYDNPPTTRGRMGWYASFADRDMAAFSFDAFALAYSTYTTTAMESFTPVDGVQLQAAYSLDDNVFVDFTGGIVSNDQQRALSADGSYRTPGPIASNSFLIFNYDQAYLDFDLWVPGDVTRENQPRVVLRSPVSADEVVLGTLDLQGNQWNHIYIDLASNNVIDGIVYQLFIERVQGQGTSYEWNVDNMVIGVRNVAWSARSAPTGTWIAFRDTVNDQFGAVHIPKDERGRFVQVKAEALTPGAWIGPFTFEPHYAELGRPTYLS